MPCVNGMFNWLLINRLTVICDLWAAFPVRLEVGRERGKRRKKRQIRDEIMWKAPERKTCRARLPLAGSYSFHFFAEAVFFQFQVEGTFGDSQFLGRQGKVAFTGMDRVPDLLTFRLFQGNG